MKLLAATSVLLTLFSSWEIVFGDGPIKHGATYRIRSGYDGGFLTAKYPKFSEDLTIKLGKAVTEEWEGDPGQIWDAIVFNKANIFWLHPKGAALNELTGFRMDTVNMLEFVEIGDGTGTYLIKNFGNGTCLQSQGINKEVVFATCDELRTVQQWDPEEFFEDRSAVDKTFAFNYSSIAHQQQSQPEIKHVCKKYLRRTFLVPGYENGGLLDDVVRLSHTPK